MSIKLALLKSGESVISDAKELISEGNVCGYLFDKPHLVEHRTSTLLIEEGGDENHDLQVSLTPWIIFSKEDKVPVRPDWIVTIVEPVEVLKDLYEEKLNGENSQTDSFGQQRNLSE